MDYSGQKPQGASSQRKHVAQTGAAVSSTGSSAAKPSGQLHLVTSSLRLTQPRCPAPFEWASAFEALAGAHKLAVHIDPPDRMVTLRKMARRADLRGGAAPPPVFAPWESFSTASFAAQHQRRVLPRAIWAASYLFDCGVNRSAAQRSVDIMYMSPHPDACLEDDDCGADLPQRNAIAAMVHAAREEGRNKLAIIVPARCCNAMARRLLAVDRDLTQGDLALEILAIEDAVGRILGDPLCWDAIIVMPELRSIVLAILAQTTDVAGPWPMLWHDRDLRLIGAETLSDEPSPVPLDATLLLQSLALAARRAGLGYEAQRLYESWARLRDQGVTTSDRDAALPYLNQVSDADFIALACVEPQSHTRPLPAWKALGNLRRNNAEAPSVQLTLVASR